MTLLPIEIRAFRYGYGLQYEVDHVGSLFLLKSLGSNWFSLIF